MKKQLYSPYLHPERIPNASRTNYINKNGRH